MGTAQPQRCTSLGNKITRLFVKKWDLKWIHGMALADQGRMVHACPPARWTTGPAKRALDILLAGTGLVLLSPLLALIFLAIRLELGAPSVFRQRRTGKDAQTFLILKFRSMRVLEDGDAILQAQTDDPRVSRVGRMLRATGLDELPQLWNVLRGEMTLVGPRPHAVAHDTYYIPQVRNYHLRFRAKPGITGWAQINNARGATPTLASMQARIDLDLWYIGHGNIWLDLIILLRTPLALWPRRR